MEKQGKEQDASETAAETCAVSRHEKFNPASMSSAPIMCSHWARSLLGPGDPKTRSLLPGEMPHATAATLNTNR